MIAVMQFGDWGVEASEAIRVTDNGSELFCNHYWYHFESATHWMFLQFLLGNENKL